MQESYEALNCYIRRDDVVRGPFNRDFLEAMLLCNICDPSTPIRVGAMEEWVSLDDFLFSCSTTTHIPLPVPWREQTADVAYRPFPKLAPIRYAADQGQTQDVMRRFESRSAKEAAGANAAQLLNQLVQSELRHLAEQQSDSNAHPEFLLVRSNRLAAKLRNIAIKACEDERNAEVAETACLLAYKLCSDNELRVQLRSDLKLIIDYRYAQACHDVFFYGGEIVGGHVRVDGNQLAVADIVGVRFGVSEETREGMFGGRRYTERVPLPKVLFLAHDQRTLVIDCSKGVPESGKQRVENYDQILKSTYYHVVPSVMGRLVTSVVRGQGTTIGPILFTSRGIFVRVGHLWWKQGITIPYNSVQTEFRQGICHVSSEACRKLRLHISVADVWNAALIPSLVERLASLDSPSFGDAENAVEVR
jgi:hypothetical protein